MKTIKEYRRYGIIAIIIVIILIIGAVTCFSLDEEFLGAICCGVAVFVLFYALLAFAVKEDEKDIKNLTPKEREEREKEADRRIFDPNNYPL